MPFSNAAIFPGSVASVAQLLNLKNQVGATLPTLAASIGTSDTSFNLAAGTGALLPTDNFMVTIDSEILFVGARSTDALSGVVRAAEGTIAAAHSSGATVNHFVTAQTHNQLAAEINAIETQLAAGVAVNLYRLIRVTNLFQGTTTYTPTAGTRALYVEGIGGGGAGGGAATASANLSVGGGGGGGAHSAVWLTGAQVKPSFTIQVGAGGTGVSGANGNPGTDTTFDSPSVCTAKAGGGGVSLAAGTSLIAVYGGTGGDQASGVGDIVFAGADGDQGLRLSASTGCGGKGGPGPWGVGTRSGNNVGAAPAASGRNYGGGGSGAFTTGTAQAGGNGANGLIRVWEFA